MNWRNGSDPANGLTTCLPLLVIRDQEAMELINNNQVITIDGCPKELCL